MMERKQYNTMILVLGALSAIGPFSIDMYLPGFPAIAAGLKTDIAHVGLSLTSYSVGISVGQICWGPLIDRYGRKRPLMIGLSAYILAALGCACSPSVYFLITLRLFQALGGCVGIVGARAVVRDLFSGKEAARVLSTLVMVFGISPIIAPTVGGFVAVTLGWRFIFLILAAIGTFILITVARYLGESKTPDSTISLHPIKVVIEYISLFREPVFVIYTCVGALGVALFFAYLAGSPLIYMKLLGFTPTQFGWIYGANAVGLVIASQINRVWLRFRNSRQILLIVVSAQFCLAIALLAWSFLGRGNGIEIIGFISCLICCQGFIGPNAMALALQPFTRKAGTAVAFLGSAQQGMGALASALVSYFYDGTAKPMIWVMAGCTAIGLMVLAGWRYQKGGETHSQG